MPHLGVVLVANIAGHIGLAAVVQPPLQSGDHYVLGKLNSQVLPWIISGRRLQKLWMVRLARFYDYTSNLAAALAGIGIGAPIAKLIANGKAPEGKTAFEILTETLPPPWPWIGIGALVVWVGLRVLVQKEDILGRALLARDCAQTMRTLYLQLYNALREPDPMPTITKVQKSVDDQVNNAMRNKVWPWDPLPPPEEILSELTVTIAIIRTNFMSGWTAPPPSVS